MPKGSQEQKRPADTITAAVTVASEIPSNQKLVRIRSGNARAKA